MTKEEKLKAFEAALDNNQAVKLGQDGTLIVLPKGSGFVAWDATNEEIGLLVAAICKTRGYKSVIPNDNYKLEEDISDENPIEVPNPITAEQFVYAFFEGVADQELAAYKNIIGEEAKQAAIDKLTLNVKLNRA